MSPPTCTQFQTTKIEHLQQDFPARLTISVVHDDTKLTLLCLVDLLEANDVRVVEHFKNLGFSESGLLVFFTHLLDVNLFNDGVGLGSRNKEGKFNGFQKLF